MKVLLAVQGYPPELRGGTEHGVQALARGLARAGLDVTVACGSDQWKQGYRLTREDDVDPASGARLTVVRLHRADAFYGNWQKGLSPWTGRTFQELVQELRPDVVHVHHWLRLSMDLVARAAAAGVPSVLTVHDLWSTCLIYFRVRPDTLRYCDVALAPDPCFACAEHIPPKTPWRTREELTQTLERRQRAILREFQLARVVVALCRDHAQALDHYLGLKERGIAVEHLPPPRELELSPAPPLAPPHELGKLVLATWGGVHMLKGPDLLVAALSALPAAGLPVELHLAGREPDPALKARLVAAAKSLPATMRVHFHGEFPEGTLARSPLGRAHAFVSGSRARETWGLVVDEAIALRLVPVLPRFGAFPEHVGERGALYYAPGDAQALSGVIQRLRTEAALWPRLASELPALEDVLPPVDEIVRRTRAYYERALAAGAPAAPKFDLSDERVDQEALERWDAALAAQPPEALGL